MEIFTKNIQLTGNNNQDLQAITNFIKLASKDTIPLSKQSFLSITIFFQTPELKTARHYQWHSISCYTKCNTKI